MEIKASLARWLFNDCLRPSQDFCRFLAIELYTPTISTRGAIVFQTSGWLLGCKRHAKHLYRVKS